MSKTLTSDLIREWRKASAEFPKPIDLDRMVIELADQVLHLRAQRDDLHEANNRLLEQRRAAQASAMEAEAELKQITEDLRGMHAELLERFNTGGQTDICGWCGAPWSTPEAARDHAVGCEKNPAVQRATAAEAEVMRLRMTAAAAAVADWCGKLQAAERVVVAAEKARDRLGSQRAIHRGRGEEWVCEVDRSVLLEIEAALADWRKP